MELVKKNKRWGYKFLCPECGKNELFRTKLQMKTSSKFMCRPCAAKIGCAAAAIKNKIHSQNNQFFRENRLKVFYWAGFIAADGYVSETDNYLQIKITDRILLERFLLDTKSTNPIFDVNDNSGFYSKNKIYRIVITNHFWVKDLKERFNIVQNKSKRLLPPNDISWSKEQIKSFLVGFLDGNGSITSASGYPVIKFYSTEPFLIWVKQKISDFYPFDFSQNSIYNREAWNICELNIYCKKAIIVMEDLYTLPIPKLDRKWDKVEKFLYNKVE